jgi:hypothetical protein
MSSKRNSPMNPFVFWEGSSNKFVGDVCWYKVLLAATTLCWEMIWMGKYIIELREAAGSVGTRGETWCGKGSTLVYDEERVSSQGKCEELHESEVVNKQRSEKGEI